MRVRGHSVFPILLAFLLLGTCACDNTIQPYSDRATYSVWGYLSTSRSLQVVRVKNLEQTLTSDPSDLPNLTVTLEDRSTETTYSLRDTVIYFEDENTRVATQNYWIDRPVKPGTEYRITLANSTGTTVHATTTTPSPTPPVAVQDTGNCLTTFTIEFPGLDEKRRLADVRVKFDVNGERMRFSEETTAPIHIRNPDTSPDHDDVFLTFEPESLLQVNLESADDPFTPCIYESLCPALTSPDANEPSDSGDIPIPPSGGDPQYKNVAVSYALLGPDWHGATSDGATPTDPLETASVSNGRGRFGALHRDQVLVKVDTVRDIPVDRPLCP